jgi:hypothetical protein
MKAAVLSVLLLAGPVSAFAQPTTPPCTRPARTYQDMWCARIADILAEKNKGPSPGLALADRIGNLVEVSGPNLRAFLLYAQARSRSLDLRMVEDARIDKQVGAPGNTSGSSSAVSKGSVPAILGFAVENGALTQSTTGSTVTFRGNLVGWLDLVQNQGFIAAYQDDSPIVRQLRRVSYSLSLNMDSAAVVAAPESGLGGLSPDAIRAQFQQIDQQLAGYSVRFAIWDQRDPRAEPNRAAVGNLLDTAGVRVLKSTDFLDSVLTSNEYLEKWLPETADQLSQPGLTDRQIEKVLYQRLEAIRIVMVNRIPDFDEHVTKTLLALEGFDKARAGVFQAMQKRPLVAFEYVNAREPDLPDRSTLRFIAEGQMGPRLDLTANVAWTIQHSGTVTLPEPATIDGTRDFQAAAQLEIPLGSVEARTSGTTGIGPPVFGVAYLSQKLTESAAISFAGNSFTLEPGWIHVLQAKVTFPVKGSGVKIPLSVSLANRTELIREQTIRGHIGLTFDMDVLSAALLGR